MSTLAELRAHRDEAGAAYATAFAALKAAWIDLSAHDLALAATKNGSPPSSFGGPRPDVVALRHPQYLPDTGATDWNDRANIAMKPIVGTLPGC